MKKCCSRCKNTIGTDLFFRNRSTKDGFSPYCKVCHKAERQNRISKNPNYYIDLYSLNKDNKRKYASEYRANNKSKISEYGQRYYSKNTESILNKAIKKRIENPEHARKLSRQKQAKRRASKLKRTPIWADLKAIKQFYYNCPKGYVIDHIIPLQGTIVSGLHVLSNLQYLTKQENLKKSNKFKEL